MTDTIFRRRSDGTFWRACRLQRPGSTGHWFKHVVPGTRIVGKWHWLRVVEVWRETGDVWACEDPALFEVHPAEGPVTIEEHQGEWRREGGERIPGNLGGSRPDLKDPTA